MHLIEQRVPLPEDDLEYEVYGWFKNEGEPDGVMALGRQWMPAAQVALVLEWTLMEEDYDQRVLKQREPFE